MLHDLKHAYRMLMHSKAWTVVVLLSLAIGIGATTALFTAVNGLLLQTVPVRDPHSLVILKSTGRNDMVRSSSDYGYSAPLGPGREGGAQHVLARDLQAAQVRESDDDRSDRRHVARSRSTSRRTAAPRLRPHLASRATTSRCWACPPLLGRTIEEGDDLPGAEPVAVLSYPFWRKRFGGDASIVGKTVRLNTATVTIVGVLPAAYTGIQRMADTPRDVTVPFAIEPQLIASQPAPRSRASTIRPTGTSRSQAG